ncbi:hypothetical protein LJC36_06035 [Desulfovibrio sp. OttesenSCG-928-C14]|nr:hypothetical protein [Desulfovibrio sp. OttesenSCG-928-C14]
MALLFIRWTKENETGIPVIDEQHRALAGIINSFFHFRDDPDIERVLVPTAEAMKDFGVIHFGTEEKLMLESGYPGYEEHSREHLLIKEEIWMEERACRNAGDAMGFLLFLKKYWTKHLEGYDREYIPHLRKYFAELEAQKKDPKPGPA